ncbi:MAG TPA: hypothetical protein VF346_02490, partial [Bacteroidales bacterium]
MWNQESGIRNQKSEIRNQEFMDLIKKYKEVIAVVLIVLILVIIRSLGASHFKNDAKKWADPSIKASNLVTAAQAAALSGNILIINFEKVPVPANEIRGEMRNISPDLVLSKKHASSIIKHSGPVLIYSSKPDLSARIRMILSQMGCKNIYILTDKSYNE